MAMKKPVKKAAKRPKTTDRNGMPLTPMEMRAYAKEKMGQKSGFGLPTAKRGSGSYGQGRVKSNYVTESEKKANTARRLNPKKK